MTRTDLEDAEKEAKRFLSRVKDMKKVQPNEYAAHGGPEAAAVKRASMDLTRALARVRRSDGC